MHFTCNNNVNTLFLNPEIPGFGLSQSRDFGIKQRSGIPGLQSLTASIIYRAARRKRPLSGHIAATERSYRDRQAGGQPISWQAPGCRNTDHADGSHNSVL